MRCLPGTDAIHICQARAVVQKMPDLKLELLLCDVAQPVETCRCNYTFSWPCELPVQQALHLRMQGQAMMHGQSLTIYCHCHAHDECLEEVPMS